MGRDSSGNYTLPGGNPVVTNTAIASTWGNTTLNDLAAAFTDSLSRSGLGAMQAALLGINGLASGVSFGFANSPGTGMWSQSVGYLNLATAGVNRVSIDSNGSVSIGASSANYTFAITSGPSATFGTILLQASVVAGQSLGPLIQAGTNAADAALRVYNAGGGTNLLSVLGDGGVVIGAPTGGNKGPGTLNIQGTLYVNGVAVTVP